MKYQKGKYRRYFISFCPGGRTEALGLYFTLRKAMEIIKRLNNLKNHGPVYFVVEEKTGDVFNEWGKVEA